ncbi:hypothetical protein CMV_022329 [Castanea mollissima]|uniref:Uncharacterized protein n=1 Tax=Castanea mollissima TaxID=60419 RepID=A0A8J4QII9_9ROSI|nr:hypothetical protein CMV_022329 [Castanea mollissima]
MSFSSQLIGGSASSVARSVVVGSSRRRSLTHHLCEPSISLTLSFTVSLSLSEFDALTGSKISSIDIGAPVVRMSYSPTSGHAVIAMLEVCLQIASCLGCLNCVEYSNTSGV